MCLEVGGTSYRMAQNCDLILQAAWGGSIKNEAQKSEGLSLSTLDCVSVTVTTGPHSSTFLMCGCVATTKKTHVGCVCVMDSTDPPCPFCHWAGRCLGCLAYHCLEAAFKPLFVTHLFLSACAFPSVSL